MFSTKEVYPWLRSKGYTPLESLLCCIVMATESNFSKGWKTVVDSKGQLVLGPDGKPMPSVTNSWNYGAIQAIGNQPFFYYPDGNSEGHGYWRYRVYPDMVSGLMSTVNTVLAPETRAALSTGSLTAGLAAMRKRNYYQTMENIDSHARALIHKLIALRGQQDGSPPDVIQRTIRYTKDPALMKVFPIRPLWIALYDRGSPSVTWAAPAPLDQVTAYRLLATSVPVKPGRLIAFHDGLGWTPWLRHWPHDGQDRPLRLSASALAQAKTHD